MEGFFASIIFLGILTVISSIIFILIEKRKELDIAQKIDDKNYDLSSVLEDAEHMIEEMDKFSDYIVNKISSKQEEAENFLKEYAEKTTSVSKQNELGLRQNHINVNSEVVSEVATANADASTYITAKRILEKQVVKPVVAKPKEMYFAINSDIAIESSVLGRVSGESFKNSPAREKVIPLNSRHNDIIVLSKNGYSNTEIAKRLNIGKGEIELILGINK